MNVASLHLCKELYELSGWYPTELGSLYYTPHIGKDDAPQFGQNGASIPAYDLGYLLRKLPKFYEEGKIVYLLTVQPNPIGAGWQAHYRFASRTPNSSDTGSRFRQEADTPEDAAAKLAIELIRQDALPRAGDAT